MYKRQVLKNAAVPGKSITLFVDVAYIDFAGDGEEYRRFIPLLDGLQENILPVIGYSTSKTFTLYGMRCGAMICMTPNAEIAEEFKRVAEYSSRGSWSNCTRASQVVISKIYATSTKSVMLFPGTAAFFNTSSSNSQSSMVKE